MWHVLSKFISFYVCIVQHRKMNVILNYYILCVREIVLNDVER